MSVQLTISSTRQVSQLHSISSLLKTTHPTRSVFSTDTLSSSALTSLWLQLDFTPKDNVDILAKTCRTRLGSSR